MGSQCQREEPCLDMNKGCSCAYQLLLSEAFEVLFQKLPQAIVCKVPGRFGTKMFSSVIALFGGWQLVVS